MHYNAWQRDYRTHKASTAPIHHSGHLLESNLAAIQPFNTLNSKVRTCISSERVFVLKVGTFAPLPGRIRTCPFDLLKLARACLADFDSDSLRPSSVNHVIIWILILFCGRRIFPLGASSRCLSCISLLCNARVTANSVEQLVARVKVAKSERCSCASAFYLDAQVPSPSLPFSTLCRWL